MSAREGYIPPTDDPDPGEPFHHPGELSLADRLKVEPLRVLVSLAVPIVAFVLLYLSFQFLLEADAPKLVVAGVAIVVGVFGILATYIAMDRSVDLLPNTWRESVRPFVFVGPAIFVLGVFLIYPTIRTLVLSFYDARSENFVGLENYGYAFSEPVMLESYRNNLLWLVFGTVLTVGLGLAVATLADRLKRGENVAKSLVFMPMAISFVGASVVWRFIYAFRPTGEQIGLANAIWVGLGNEPVAWLTREPWNNFLLIVILIWLQTGFSMVILSAAIKGVPDDILEAARIDGATEWQVFWRIIVPSIRSTIVVVTTTMIILILKVFDIVWVMTNGEFGTEVIASRMIREAFRFLNNGRGAAIAVILLVAVVPVLILNVKRFREEEALR